MLQRHGVWVTEATLPREKDVLHFRPARAALPQVMKMLIGSQANYEKNNDILLQDNDILRKVFNIKFNTNK